jgi:hypothetical protein
MYVGCGVGVCFAWVTYEQTGRATEGELYTRPAVTFNGLIGGEYPFSELFALYADIGFQQMSFTVKKQLDVNQTTYHYEKNSESNNEYTPFKIPGSNVTLRAGVRFSVPQ